MEVISTITSFTTIEGQDHNYFAFASDEIFMNALVDALENDSEQPTTSLFGGLFGSLKALLESTVNAGKAIGGLASGDLVARAISALPRFGG